MSIIDRQRIAAVHALEGMGYAFTGGEWQRPGTFAATALREADAMHALLVHRADTLEGCSEGSDEERELAALVGAIEAYEAKRWPEGKEPGGKG
jgi:hypothetical protein